eukprot:scaffold2192_cov268-Chaetoceros_neogracile.AAC.1
MVDAYAANGVNGILFKDEDGTRGSLLSKGSEIGRHLCGINACNSLYIYIVHAELTLDGWGTVVSTFIECAKSRDRRGLPDACSCYDFVTFSSTDKSHTSDKNIHDRISI